MTWKEFKDQLEEAGVKDDTKVWTIDYDSRHEGTGLSIYVWKNENEFMVE